LDKDPKLHSEPVIAAGKIIISTTQIFIEFIKFYYSSEISVQK
jgi:hypothetical protein